MHAGNYFDHNATTPLSAEVWNAVSAAMQETFGNASSIHHYGQAAKQRLEQARRQTAALLHCGVKELVLLSGGTEANNLAIHGTTQRGDHIISTAIEHPAVLNPCHHLEAAGVQTTFVKPQPDGIVSPQSIRDALQPNTRLISVMHANNETGVIQPVDEIVQIAKKAGALLHIDGVQAAGKLKVNLSQLPADLYSISAHKLYAPKGVGALYVRTGVKLNAQMHGGHHERDRRAGTENVPGFIGLGAACEWLMHHGEEESQRLAALRDRFEQGVLAQLPDVFVNGNTQHRLPNTSNLGFEGIEGEAMVIALDLRGFAVSSGSACSSGAVEPSHVLLAMGLSAESARSSLRISLGRSNTQQDVDALITAVAESAKHLRRVSTAYSHA